MSELHSSPSNSQTPPPGVVASTSQEGVTQEGQTAATTETPSPSILSSQKAEVLEQLLSAKLITPKEYKITFRGTSEKKAKELQAAGKPVPVKRPEFKISLPIINVDGLITALDNQKQREYILSVLEDSVYKEARYQVDDETSPINSQSELDVSKLTLEYLANRPPSERLSGGISKETWEAFTEDYINVMPGLSTSQTVSSILMVRLTNILPAKKILHRT